MNASTSNVFDHPRFDKNDFLRRWEGARLSALRSVLHDEGIQGASVAEALLLKQVRCENRERLLRSVFDCSRKFGLNARRYLGTSFTLRDLAQLLQGSTIPCFKGHWLIQDSSYFLERNGCHAFSDIGDLACDYWREAIDGLIMGAGENERMARHRSLGHGDSTCVDVLFTQEFSAQKSISSSVIEESAALKFGALPNDMETELQNLGDYFKLKKIGLRFAGYSEGVLYYELKAYEGVLCGSEGKRVHELFHRELSKRFPSLKTQDVSPLAVYGSAT